MKKGTKIIIGIGIIILLIASIVSLFLLPNKSSPDEKMDEFYECSKNCYIYTRTDEIQECMTKNCYIILEVLLLENYEGDMYQFISALNEENKQIIKCMNNCEELDNEQIFKCFELCLY